MEIQSDLAKVTWPGVGSWDAHPTPSAKSLSVAQDAGSGGGQEEILVVTR